MATATCCTPPNIDELEEQLLNTERDLATKTKERDSLRENIAAVQRTQTELSQSGDSYKKALDGLKIAERELEDYYELKWRMIQCAVEKHREDIDNIIEAHNTKIENQRYKINDLRDKEAEASLAYDQANVTLEEKKNRFDEYKDYKTRVDKIIREIQGFKTKVEKEDDASHPASMYVLLLEMKSLLDQVQLISPDELNRIVQERWCEFYDATNEARDKKTVLDEIKQALKAEEIVLQELEQKRLDSILSCVSKYNANTKPCPPPTASSKRSGATVQ